MKETTDSIKLGNVEVPAKMIDYDTYDYLTGTIVIKNKEFSSIKVIGIDEDADDNNNNEEENEQNEEEVGG